MVNSYENIPVPGQHVGPSYTDDEVLYSSAIGSYTQKCVTLAGGQGVLPAGTVLARKTSDKKYYVYNNGGSGGLEVARGVLRKAADTGAAGSADQLANILIRGVLKLDLVSGADSAAIVDLGARVDDTRNTFIF